MNPTETRRTAGISILEIMLAVTLLVLLVGIGFFFLRSREGHKDKTAPALLADASAGGSHGTLDGLGGPAHGGQAGQGDEEDPDPGWDREDNSEGSRGPAPQGLPTYQVTDRTSGVMIGQALRDYFGPALAESGGPDWGSFISLVGRLDTAQLPAAWALLQEQPWSSEKQETMEVFMAHWARQDAEAALEFARSLTSSRQRHLAYSTAIKTWAMTDPESALTWYEERVSAGEGVPGPAFFAGLHAADPEAALALVWDIEDSKRSAQMLRAMFLPADGDRESGATSLKALFDVEEDPERRALLSRMVADVWAADDPMRAVAWAQEFEEDPSVQHGIYMAAARSWGRREPAATMAWLQENDIENIDNGVIYQLTRSWSHDDAASMGQWIETTPPSALRDSVVGTEVRHLQYRNPAAALAMAESLSESAGRYKVMASVADRWMRRDKNAAASAVLASSMPPEMKRKYAMKVIPKNRQRK